MGILSFKISNVQADLSSPAWFDPDGVSTGDDWHYRAPINITNGAVGDTVIFTATYATLLSQVGVTGTFDTQSLRVLRPNGTSLVAQQSYTDNGTTAEIEFVLEDAASTTYYLYFDITQNAAAQKSAPSNTLNAVWADTDWSARQPITIDNSANANALKEYQLRLSLTAAQTDFWAKVRSDGTDVRFYEADGTQDDYYI